MEGAEEGEWEGAGAVAFALRDRDYLVRSSSDLDNAFSDHLRKRVDNLREEIPLESRSF